MSTSAFCDQQAPAKTENYSPQSRVPVEVLAAQYNIRLPAPEELPKSYTSVRMWLNRRIATLDGRNKRVWQELRMDQSRLAYVREQNKARVKAYRARHCQPKTMVGQNSDMDVVY